MTKSSKYIETRTRETFTDIHDEEFDAVQFVECTFDAANARNTKFIDCAFDKCSLSSMKIEDAVIQASFVDSKIEGLNFFTAKPALLAISFDRTLIRYSSFATLVLKKIQFKDCTLQHVDFADATLTEASFAGCTFEDCTFQNTDLTKADFRLSRGYTISPLVNKLTKARFDLPEAISLLDVFGLKIE
jgi:uncharacterized protein YjbI with pentapeptide repeats